MAHVRVQVEKEIIERLNQKANSHQSVEQVFTKAFKYYDLTNNGLVDQNQFLKAVERIGVTIENPQDFYEVFQYYDLDKDGKVNYKEFIGLMFENLTAQTRQFSPKKNQPPKVSDLKGFNPQDYILLLKKRIIEKGGANGLLQLAAQFSNEDQVGTRELNFEQFYGYLNQQRINFSQEDAQHVFFYFDKQRNGAISFDELLQGLRGPMDFRRLELVRLLYSYLDREQQGFLYLQQLRTNFNARIHPDVRINRKTEKEIMQEHLTNLKNYEDYIGITDGKITGVEFEDFFSFLSSEIQSDNHFELYVQNCWGVSDSRPQSQVFHP